MPPMAPGVWMLRNESCAVRLLPGYGRTIEVTLDGWCRATNAIHVYPGNKLSSHYGRCEVDIDAKCNYAIWRSTTHRGGAVESVSAGSVQYPRMLKVTNDPVYRVPLCVTELRWPRLMVAT